MGTVAGARRVRAADLADPTQALVALNTVTGRAPPPGKLKSSTMSPFRVTCFNLNLPPMYLSTLGFSRSRQPAAAVIHCDLTQRGAWAVAHLCVAHLCRNQIAV